MSKIASHFRLNIWEEVSILVKRFLGSILIIAMLIAVPAHAASSRTFRVFPDLEFNGTTATCTVAIMANHTSDKIVATTALWQGSTLVDSWNSSGSGTLKISETATVSKNKTYKLVVNYSINGTSYSPVSISRTNNN